MVTVIHLQLELLQQHMSDKSKESTRREEGKENWRVSKSWLDSLIAANNRDARVSWPFIFNIRNLEQSRICFIISLSSYSFFFFLSLFPLFFSDCLIIDQLGWLLFNVQKKAISHGQNENLIHSQDQDKNFDDYGDEIFKVRPNTLCVKKVK